MEPSKPLEHIGMLIFQTEKEIYLSMESYIKTMLAKLNMEGALGLKVCTPIRKPIDNLSPVSPEQAAFFMSATGMLGWLAFTGRLDVKYAHSQISQHMSWPGRGALDTVIYAIKYCASTSAASLH